MYTIRLLKKNDYHKNYLQLLSQLTQCPKISEEKFNKIYNLINLNKYHNIFVIENNNKIIASITCLTEPKFFRNTKFVAYIEDVDVVVDPENRGKGIAKLLNSHVINYSKNNNCYKIILNCSNDYISFYSKFGFKSKNKEMSLYGVDV